MASRNSTKRRRAAERRVLILAVAYIRMSSDKQEASPEQQKAEILKLTEREGYRIIRWYQDDGIAGWKEEREGFQRLIADIDRGGDFQAVLCWGQNRFSRFPVLEANHYWFLLDRAGIHLCTVNQGKIDWSSIAGWLTASIKQHADSQHRFQLSADVKRGKRARAEEGDWQERIPFAYEVVDCRLQLGDPLQVELVQRLFREYLEGRSLRSICHRFNAEGLHSLNGGKPWIPGGLRHKLVNPAYAGIFRWKDIEILENHPAIISVADFNRVQEILSARQRQTTPRQDGGGFLFTRLLKCGKFGRPMSGWNARLHYYKCQGAMGAGSKVCEGNTVKQADLFPAVVDAIEQHWMNPKVVKRLRDELHRQVDHDKPAVDPNRLQKQLSGIDAKLTKAKRRLVEVDTDMLPVVQEHLRDLLQQREQLQGALRTAQTPRERIYDHVEENRQSHAAIFYALTDIQKSRSGAPSGILPGSHQTHRRLGGLHHERSEAIISAGSGCHPTASE